MVLENATKTVNSPSKSFTQVKIAQFKSTALVYLKRKPLKTARKSKKNFSTRRHTICLNSSSSLFTQILKDHKLSDEERRKKDLSLYGRVFIKPSLQRPRHRNNAIVPSKKEASSRPSRWTQTGRKRGTPPNRSCDQARENAPTPSMSAHAESSPPPLPVVSPTVKRHAHHQIYIKTAYAPRQSIQTKLKLCRGVLMPATHSRTNPPKLSFPTTMRVMPINQGGASALR